MSRTHAATTSPEQDRRRRRVAALKITLGSAALLAVGVAATSAAWTDQAWFSANANGASFELQGSYDGGTFVSADEGGAIVIPAAKLANLVPGDERSFAIEIKNTGSVPMAISSTHSWLPSQTGNGFVSAPTVGLTGVPSTLAKDATATVTVAVTVPTDWAAGNQTRAQDLEIVFTGTSVATS